MTPAPGNRPSVSRVRLYDRHFEHIGVAGGKYAWPEVGFQWDRKDDSLSCAVFTDDSVQSVLRSPHQVNVAWLMESPAATRKRYMWVARNHSRFDRVLTFDEDMLDSLPNARRVLLGGCWIRPENRHLQRKSDGISIIASAKADMPGQRLRHEVVRRHRSRLDLVVGHGYKPIADKVDALGPFRFSIVIENCRRNFYFSEKLIDCFATGTIPIYWGCPAIGAFFNPQGLLPFSTAAELELALDIANEATYAERLPAVRENLIRARAYVATEQHVANGLSDLISRFHEITQAPR